MRDSTCAVVNASFLAEVTLTELLAEGAVAVSLLAKVTSAESLLAKIILAESLLPSILLCLFNICILKLFIH